MTRDDRDLDLVDLACTVCGEAYGLRCCEECDWYACEDCAADEGVRDVEGCWHCRQHATGEHLWYGLDMVRSRHRKLLDAVALVLQYGTPEDQTNAVRRILSRAYDEAAE